MGRIRAQPGRAHGIAHFDLAGQRRGGQSRGNDAEHAQQLRLDACLAINRSIRTPESRGHLGRKRLAAEGQL